MGMYTEFHFNSALKDDVPEDVIAILRMMLGEEVGISETLPDHPLFKTSRWKWMLQCDSYYFDADTVSTLRWDVIGKQYYLCIRCNLKNYDQEIEKFADWIYPYLDKCTDERVVGEFLGFKRYESSETPTLLFYGKNGPVWGNVWWGEPFVPEEC